MKWLLYAAGVLSLAVLAARQSAAPGEGGYTFSGGLDWLPEGTGFGFETEPTQTNDLIDDAMAIFDPTNYLPVGVPADVAGRNQRAFLDMIAYAEGTNGADGYRTMFGYRYFDDFSDHPRQYFSFTDGQGRSLKTSAAGRYQFLVRTWDTLRARLGLPDFSPASQDAAALELIRERGALNDVSAGRVESAIRKVRTIWASLPGAGYSQPERSISNLLAAYKNAGGALA